MFRTTTLSYYWIHFLRSTFKHHRDLWKNILKSSFRSPLLQIEEEKREHEEKLKRMEAEMHAVFEAKVQEKRNKLQESDTEVCLGIRWWWKWWCWWWWLRVIIWWGSWRFKELIHPWSQHSFYDEVIVLEQLRRRQEQMMKSLEQQEAEFLEMKKAFNAERDTWEEQIKQHEAELTRFASFQLSFILNFCQTLSYSIISILEDGW